MDAFLQEQQRVGWRDSEGCFTLDLERALAKLGRYRLASPYQFQHKLLQAAVVGGAREITFGCGDSAGLEVTVRGLSVPPEQFRKLLSFALETGADRHLGYLAQAACAAFQLGTRTAELEAWTDVGQRLTCTRGLIRLERNVPAREMRPGLRVRLSQGFPGDLMVAGKGGWHRGHTGVYCPIPVIENGKPQNRLLRSAGERLGDSDIPLAEPTTWQRFIVAGKPASALLPGPSSPAPPLRSFRWVERPGDPPQELESLDQAVRLPWLTVAGQRALGCWANLYGGTLGTNLTWVRDGLLIETDCYSLNRGKACSVVASAEGLATDLSGYKLVRDEAYAARVAWLAAQVEDAAR